MLKKQFNGHEIFKRMTYSHNLEYKFHMINKTTMICMCTTSSSSSHSSSEQFDYNAVNMELMFDKDTSRACARIRIIEDRTLEAVESFNVILSTTDTHVSLEPQTATVFISDNDSKSDT